MANKDVAKIVKAAESQGFRVKRVKSGHFHFWAPNGEYVCNLSGTPGSQREVTNKLQKLRKAGLRF